MFSHVVLGANDLQLSRLFYDAMLGVLGVKPGVLSTHVNDFGEDNDRYVYQNSDTRLFITAPINKKPVTLSNGFTLGFRAINYLQVDQAYEAALEHGGKKLFAPRVSGPINRRSYRAYVKDPAGHKIGIFHFLTHQNPI